MNIIVPGHLYELANFEHKDKTGQPLQFIHKEADFDDPTNLITKQDGNTTEEVIAVLIDRTEFLNKKFPCRENALAITRLEEALMWLNQRTANRVKRAVEGTHKP